MKAFLITPGKLVDLGMGRTPAEVLDVEIDGHMVALRLRQEGKRRGCWVALPASNNVRTVRR